MATTFTKNPDGSVTISDSSETTQTIFDLITRRQVLMQRLEMIDAQIERQYGQQKQAVMNQIDTVNAQIAVIQGM
jgi:hypothetical protein